MKKAWINFVSIIVITAIAATQWLSVSDDRSFHFFDIEGSVAATEEQALIRTEELLPVLGASADSMYTVYTGSNVNSQNYYRWSSTVKSYLTQPDAQTIMRVQGNAVSGVLVEYYDLSYTLLNTKIVAQELPIFGGFYETSSNYFIISGQTNPEESNTKEVVRVTKYDKDWNKISTASLANCNTVIPFDAGSLRVSQSGNYLIIRTSHEMYTSSDGYNHQANMTFQVNTASSPMTITDKQYTVYNIGTGYVSHSFNQFVKVDGNQLVAVDHGDAYPRSIVLIKYGRDVSTGLFNSTCTNVPIMTFPGTIGNNSTGASVGAFEISSANYLVAGNSVVQDSTNTSRTTRNIFVASVSKSSSAVTMNWITNYSEGTTTTTTPQMVKIAADTYVLIWSRGDQVYYTKINGSGQKVSDIYNFSGSLSDCAPIVVSGKIVWYTWSSADVKFYEISTTNLAENGVRPITIPDPNNPVPIPSPTPTDDPAPPAFGVSYRTHIQEMGWQGYRSNGTMAGTSGQSLRLEGIKIKISGDPNLGVQYTTHVQDYGWLPWCANDEMSGTEGESKRLEAIKIQLTGSSKNLYDIYYRVHAQDFGWLGWASNGAAAGTAGYSKRLEAIEVVIVAKGATAPGSAARAYVANGGTQDVPGANATNVGYRTHIQNVGWQGFRYNGQMSGTSGRSLRLEGINIKLTNQQYSGGIRYTTHVQDVGWQNFVANGEMSGTSGRSLRLEAIKIELTGEMANQYDIYYRVHVQDFGWLGWAKNGQPSGSQGHSKRLEGIEVVLVKKGGAAPGTTVNSFIQ